MKTILRESMTPLRIGPYKVRVWRQEAEEGPIDTSDLRNLSAPWGNAHPNYESSSDAMLCIARQILNVDRVNAVEVLNEDGVGQVLYADWP